MAQGQQLRWWQDNEENQAVQQASERVTSAPAVLLSDATALPANEQVTRAEEVPDTWAELEAEALRCSQQVKTEEGEEVSFYLDKTVALVRHGRDTRNSVFVITASIILTFLVQATVPEYCRYLPSAAGWVGVFGVSIIHTIRRSKWLRNLDKPVVRLSPEGIHLHTFDRLNTMLPWNDVTAVMPKRFFKTRYLELRDTKRGQFIILEQDLPVTPESLAARITNYKAAREID